MRFYERWAPPVLHLALLAAVALAGCGDDDAPSAPAGASGAGQAGAPGGQGGSGGQGGAPGGQAGAPGGQGGAPPDPFGDPACGGAFCSQLSAPPANDLYAVAAAGSSVFAVGAGGTVLRGRGGTWKALFVPGAPTLRGVWAVGEDELWAVGDFGAVVHVDGAGATLLAPPTFEGLRGIWGAAPNDLWVAGDAGTLLHFDGAAWTAVTEVAVGSDEVRPPDGPLYAVWGSGPNDVWAVGGKLNTGSAYHFDGTRWAGIDGFSIDGALFVVNGAGPDNVWAAGEYGYIYRLHTAPGSDAYVTYDQFYLVNNETEASAVGGLVVRSPTDALAFSDRRVWHWDGAAWAQTALEAGMPAAPAGDEIWSVGPGGRTFRLDAAGAHADLAPGRLSRAHVASDTNALAIGDFDDSQQLQARRWNGTAWAPVALPPGAPRLGGTLDGSSVLISCTGDANNRTFTATVYADGVADAVTLPPVQPTGQGSPFDVVVGGASTSDLWLAADDLLWHFDGVAWTPTLAPGAVPGTGPGSRSVSLTGQVSAFAPNDVWVSGRVLKFDADYGQIYVAHYDGTAWVERTPSIVSTDDAYVLSSYMAASGPDEVYVGLAFGRSLDDNPPGHQDGFEGRVAVPALYHWAAGVWQQVALPDVGDAFRGTEGLTLAARDSRLYVGMRSTHPGAGKLLVREGEAWSRLEAPVFGVGAIYPTAGSLWIENFGVDYSFYFYPAAGIDDYSPFFPFAHAWTGELRHAGNDLLRRR